MNEIQTISEATIISKIYELRGKKVMIDRDLANLYDVETRVLNQSVKRNQKRFPEDFMFQMTTEEMKYWKSQIVISNNEKMGLRKSPMAFTEQGVAMLSSVLNSDRAIMVNIRIIRVFTKIRELLATQKDILRKLEEIEKKDLDQDKKINLIFEYLKQFEKARQTEAQQKNRPKIGFQPGKKD
jgi:hypothetical protein